MLTINFFTLFLTKKHEKILLFQKKVVPLHRN